MPRGNPGGSPPSAGAPSSMPLTWEADRQQQGCGSRLRLRRDVHRRTRAALDEHDAKLHERRCRLQQLLEVEELHLLQEVEEQRETVVEKQARMRERVKELKKRREKERMEEVEEKMEQLFREQCEELRCIQSQRRQQLVCQEQEVQVRSRREQQQLQQQEEQLFHKLWEADHKAKEERESAHSQERRRKNLEQLNVLRSQTEETERRRQQEKKLREEEARLMLQQQEMLLLQEQRNRQQKLQKQNQCRQQLDRGFRMKMRRLAREQQEELELDMKILQEVFQQHTDEQQLAEQKKVELWESQQRHRQHLSEELERRRMEEQEIEQLLEEKLHEVWTKREEKSRLEREARNLLMEQVMEARRLQIQNKLDENRQKRAELQKDREELSRAIEESKMKDEEEKKSRRCAAEAYRADLQAQIAEQQQMSSIRKAQENREHQQGLILEQIYNRRRDRILAEPQNHRTSMHPFRRGAQRDLFHL